MKEVYVLWGRIWSHEGVFDHDGDDEPILPGLKIKKRIVNS